MHSFLCQLERSQNQHFELTKVECGVLEVVASLGPGRRGEDIVGELMIAGACPGEKGKRGVDCQSNREPQTMLPSRQVVYQHGSPGCLNTCTDVVEATGQSSH
jgi:hypothetical protein